MFIQTESTPNPLTLKFIPGIAVMPQGAQAQTAFYTSAEAAKDSPLAQALFGIDGVSAVFLAADFLSVTRTDSMDWITLKPMLLHTIMDHFVAGRPVIIGKQDAEENTEEDSEIVAQIKELIETRVRPAVAMDGGDIVYRGFHDGIVQLELHGACSGCPSSSATLKSGIENMLKHYVPEVVSVEAV